MGNAMDDKDFIVEAIGRLVPESRWEGESCHDDDAAANAIPASEAALYAVLNRIFDGQYDALHGVKWNASAVSILEGKQAVLKRLVEWLNDRFDLEADTGYFIDAACRENADI